MGGVVAIDQGWAVQRIGDQVQVAIIVQVGRDQAVGNPRGVKSPGLANVLEGQVAPVAEGEFGRFQSGIFAQDRFGGLNILVGSGLDPFVDIAVVDVVGVAVGNQQILPTVEVHIDKQGNPRPARSRDAGKGGNLGISSIASVPVQTIAGELLPFFTQTGKALEWLSSAGGPEVLPQIVVQHLDDAEVISAVAIEVSEVHAHGGQTHVSKGKLGGFPELSFSITPPQPVRSLEIVTDVKVLKSVAIDIPHLHRQTEVPRRRKGFTFPVQERLLPGHLGKTSGSVIEQEGIRFTELVENALHDFEAIGEAARDLGLAVDHSGGDNDAIPQHGLNGKIAEVEVQIAIAVDIPQGEGGCPGFAADS